MLGPFFMRQLSYQAIDNTWRALKPMPVISTYELFSAYEQLIRRLNELDQDKEIWALYAEDSYFASLCDTCLKTAGIEPKDCSPEMLISFLFPHIADDDKLVEQGIIFSFNFPAKSRKSKKPNKNTELAEIVAALWGATESLSEANKLLSELSLEELEALLKYRKQLLKPEKERKQEAGFEDAMQIMKDKGLII